MGLRSGSARVAVAMGEGRQSAPNRPAAKSAITLTPWLAGKGFGES